MRLLSALLTLTLAACDANPLSLAVSADGSFTLTAPSWPNLVLSSAPVGVRWAGVWLSAGDGSLSMTSQSPWSVGADAWGDYNTTTFSWARASDGAAAMRTSFRVYATSPAIGFTATFPTAIATNATAKDLEGVVSAFPSFALPATSPLAAVAWYGSFVNEGTNGPLFPAFTSSATFPSAIAGGPLVLLDASGAASLVLSASSEFMAVSTAKVGSALSLGVLGSVGALPAGYSYDTVAWLGAGVTANAMAWGQALLSKHGKVHGLSKTDFTNTHLGEMRCACAESFSHRTQLTFSCPPQVITQITARTTTTPLARTLP